MKFEDLRAKNPMVALWLIFRWCEEIAGWICIEPCEIEDGEIVKEYYFGNMGCNVYLGVAV